MGGPAPECVCNGPAGAGLSSSSAFVCVAALALLAAFDFAHQSKTVRLTVLLPLTRDVTAPRGSWLECCSSRHCTCLVYVIPCYSTGSAAVEIQTVFRFTSSWCYCEPGTV